VLAVGMSEGVVSPRLPELVHGTLDPTMTSGLAGTVWYLGVFLFPFFFARFIARWRFPGLTAGMAGYTIALVLLGRVQEPESLVAVRFAEGLFLGISLACAESALVEFTGLSSSRLRIMAVLGAGLGIGACLSLFAGSAALALGFHLDPTSPRVPLTLVAAICLVVGVLAGKFAFPSSRGTAGHRSLDAGIVACGSTYGFLESTALAVLPLLAISPFRVAPEFCLLGLVGGAWGGAAIGARGTGGIAGLRAWLGGATFAFAGLGIAAPYLPEACGYLAALGLGLCGGGILRSAFGARSVAQTAADHRLGDSWGGFLRGYGMASLCGPLVVGMAAQVYGARGFFGALAGFALVGWALSFWQSPRARTHRDSPEKVSRAA
jgi:MFS family permease